RSCPGMRRNLKRGSARRRQRNHEWRQGALRGWLPGAVAATIITTMVAMIQVACSSAPRREQQPQPVQSASVEQYVAAIKANAQRSDHESDSRLRADLAAQSSSDADACLALDAHSAACQYGKALATGLEARAHPARAVGLLSSMLQNLRNAE